MQQNLHHNQHVDPKDILSLSPQGTRKFYVFLSVPSPTDYSQFGNMFSPPASLAVHLPARMTTTMRQNHQLTHQPLFRQPLFPLTYMHTSRFIVSMVVRVPHYYILRLICHIQV
ncbi:hypothetical protein CY34DRAFT_437383 [Suillus luteus UH-Slu-Lm8-n1]|uniref:Uncharacterized protein n=1 Tax=Suillus luteus UH-Slu-Lm8-n1 TaxID=930992 RepID=A0A0D0AG51_9AGAM|nr:hypothetical protein CY34DRAFT_437383 [Suillus luteus UH-Slu-Lm8-n1]